MSNKGLPWMKYPKIDRIKPSLIKKLDPEDIKAKWIVLEKAHGANFSFVTDGKDIECTRREDKLSPSETFYNWQALVKKYKEKIFELHQIVKETIKEDFLTIQIFGELIGGIYPKDDIEDLGLIPVQKGIYYCPWTDFYAFDICLIMEKEKKKWVNYNDAMKIFEKVGLFYAKPLFEGTLEECHKYDIKFNTIIPKELNLPEIEKNQCEGVIIKSIEPINDKGGQKGRVIFKHKNENFEEVNPKPNQPTKHELERMKKKETEEKFYDELERYINENRKIALESKIGIITKENFDKALDRYVLDILEDFQKDFPDLWNDYQRKENVPKNLKSMSTAFLKKYL